MKSVASIKANRTFLTRTEAIITQMPADISKSQKESKDWGHHIIILLTTDGIQDDGKVKENRKTMAPGI